jgi:Cu/Ag efflux protein CusF
MTRHLAVAVFALIAPLMLGACAKKQPAPVPAPTTTVTTSTSKNSLEQRKVTTVTATVVAVDQAKRTVTLRGPEGNVSTMKVGDEVKNLAQVRKGDQVSAAYYESLAVSVKKPGTAKPGVVQTDDIATAPAGQKPGGAGASTVTIVAKVKKVDKATQSLTLQGGDGSTTTVKVEDPANLEKVKAGDLLEITYTEAVAISVDKP